MQRSMTKRRFRAIAVVRVLSAALILHGCSNDPAECPTGAETCPCAQSGGCNDGLTCASDICVDLAGPDPDPMLGDARPVGENASGFLVLSPQGLQLLPGATATISAAWFDSLSVQQPSPSGTWTNETPQILTLVDQTTVFALAPGLGELTFAANTNTVERLAIYVTDNPVAGPVAIQFEQPLYTVRIGETTPLRFRLTDSSGMEVPGSFEIEWTVEGSAGVTIANNQLVGQAVGAGFISSRIPLDAGTLFGETNVIVISTLR